MAKKLNTPSANSLIPREHRIRAIQELYDAVRNGGGGGGGTEDLTPAQKAALNSGITADKLNELETGVSGAVQTSSQSLTESQKSTARNNIGALGTNDVPPVPSGGWAAANDLSALDAYVHSLNTTPVVVGPKPDTGTEGTIYRVPGDTTYTDWMYYNGTWNALATYDVATLESQFGYYKWTGTGNAIALTTSNQDAGSPIGSYDIKTGGSFKIKMTNAATGAATLSMNGKTATPLYYNGATVSASNSWEAGEVVDVYYDGTNYQATIAQGSGGKAEKIEYDNSQSGLANNVQGALDDVVKNAAESSRISVNISSLRQLANWTGSNGNVVTTSEAKHINIPLDGYSYIRMVAGTFICYYIFASAVNGNSWTPVASYRYEIPTGEDSGNIRIPSGATHLIVGIVYNGTDSPDCTPASVELITENAKDIEDTVDSTMPTEVSLSKAVADANYYQAGDIINRTTGNLLHTKSYNSYIIPIYEVLRNASCVYIQRNKASKTTAVFSFLTKVPAVGDTISYVGEQMLIDNNQTDTYQGLSIIGEFNFSLNKIPIPQGANYLYITGNQSPSGSIDNNKYPENLIFSNEISIEKIKTKVGDLSNDVLSLCLDEKSLVQGSTMNASGADAIDSACVRTPYLELGNKTSVIVYNNHTLDDGYQLYFKHTWYDSNKTFISVSAWTYEVEMQVPSEALGGYDRLVIKRMKATTAVTSTIPADIAIYKLYLNVYGYNGIENRLTMAESLLTKIMKGLSPRTLTVASWNIGHFSLGQSKNSTITGSAYNNKLAAFRTLVYNTLNPRLISLNEYSLVFGTDSGSVEHNARDVLFNDFGIKWEGAQMNYSCNAVYGNLYIDDIEFHVYECLRNAVITHSSAILATDYYYVMADIYLEGRLVKFITTHMAFDNNYPSVLQEAQMAELVNVLSGYDRVLVMGDFNVAAQSDFDAFVNAGYTLGNDGTVTTYPSASKCLDNIIVKGLTLSNFRAITDNLSDHYPVAAEISL